MSPRPIVVIVDAAGLPRRSVATAIGRAVEAALGAVRGARCEAVDSGAHRCTLAADGHEVHAARGKRWIGSGDGAHEVPPAARKSSKTAPRPRRK